MIQKLTFKSKHCQIHNQECIYMNLNKDDLNYLQYQCEFCQHHKSIKIVDALSNLKKIQCSEEKSAIYLQVEKTLQLLMNKASNFREHINHICEQLSQQYQLSIRLSKLNEQISNLKKIDQFQLQHLDEVGKILVNEDSKKISVFTSDVASYLKELHNIFSDIEQRLQANRKNQQQLEIVNQVQQKIEVRKQTPPKQRVEIALQQNDKNDTFKKVNVYQSTIIVYAITFSFDDSKLVIGGGNINNNSENKNLLVLGIGDDKKEEQFLYGHTKRVTALSYSKLSHFFISGSLDFTLRLWNSNNSGKDWECLKVLNQHTSTVFGIVLDTDESQIFSCSHDTTIIVWGKEKQQLTEWSKQQILNGHQSSVNGICLSDDNSYLATGSDDKQVLLWTKNQGQQWVIKQTIHNLKNGFIYTLCFFKDNTLAVGTHEGEIQIWKRVLESEFKLIYAVNPLCGYIKKIAYNPSEQLLVTKCEHKTIIWKIDHLDNINNIQEYPGEYLGVAVSNFQSLIAMFNCDDHKLEVLKYNK